MISVIIGVVLAALVYFLALYVGLPAIVAVIAAILVMLAAVPRRTYWR